ncbi:hypothetical protein E2320_005413, partial [Naja naja]
FRMEDYFVFLQNWEQSMKDQTANSLQVHTVVQCQFWRLGTKIDIYRECILPDTVSLTVVMNDTEREIDPTWSETGDRYLLKLFRDHLFHQVTEAGTPWIDLSHIISCLNK